MENCKTPIMHVKQGVYVFTLSIFAFVFILLFLALNHVTRRPWWSIQKKFLGKICIKIEFISQRRETLLFLTTNMSAVTSLANQHFVIIFVKCILLVILPTVLIFYFEQLYFISVSTIDLSEVNLQDLFRTEAFRFAFGFAFDVFSVILLSIFFPFVFWPLQSHLQYPR